MRSRSAKSVCRAMTSIGWRLCSIISRAASARRFSTALAGKRSRGACAARSEIRETHRSLSATRRFAPTSVAATTLRWAAHQDGTAGAAARKEGRELQLAPPRGDHRTIFDKLEEVAAN